MLHWVLKSFAELTVPEFYAVMRLRQEVFVVEQNCPYLDADGKDQKSHHLMGYAGEELVAYARLVKPGISYNEVSIGRVVSATKHRGSSFGKQLMTQSIEEINKIYGPVPIRISAQQYLQKFYEGFGFGRLSEDPYMEDFIPHVEMLRS